MLINQLPKVFLCSFWLINNSRLWHLIRIAHIYLWKLWNWNYGWSLSCFRLSRPARMKTIETMTGPILRITTAAHPQGNKPSITEIPFTITDTKQSPTRHKTVDIVWNFYSTNWNADACDWCSQNWGMIEHRNRIVLCSKDVCCRPRMGYPAVDQWFIFWTPGKLCWADTLHIFNETFRRLCLLIKKYYLV